MSAAVDAGMVFEREHPFTLCVENRGDPEFESERWRPGAWETKMIAPDDAVALAHAIGRARFTVVSVHTPPGYPTRVFYKRQFFMPDGSAYRPGNLRNSILSKFRRDVAKFPFAYEVDNLWDGDVLTHPDATSHPERTA